MRVPWTGACSSSQSLCSKSRLSSAAGTALGEGSWALEQVEFSLCLHPGWARAIKSMGQGTLVPAPWAPGKPGSMNMNNKGHAFIYPFI